MKSAQSIQRASVKKNARKKATKRFNREHRIMMKRALHQIVRLRVDPLVEVPVVETPVATEVPQTETETK